MNISPLKTDIISPGDALISILDKYVPTLPEHSVLAISSKIVSLCEHRLISQAPPIAKEQLIKDECQAYMKGPYDVFLTITNGQLVASAGIDESNSAGSYILYPSDVQKSATDMWTYLRQRDKVVSLGIIITDSHTKPLRRGVIGSGLGWCGFCALKSYIDHEDLHGNTLQHTHVNVLDSLASAAVLVMGEGNESTPMALITSAPDIQFQDHPPSSLELNQLQVALEDDLYEPLINSPNWIWIKRIK